MANLDFWFEPKGMKPPKPWKQYLLATSAVYPLSLIIPKLLGPLFRVAPSLGNDFISGLLVAAILTAADVRGYASLHAIGEQMAL